jgi:recombination protein RecA
MTKDIVESMKREVAHEKDKQELLSTGSTLLNLALSNNPRGGLQKGKLVNIIGDSGVGKTLISLSILAEACRDENYKDFDLVLRDCEARNNFPVERLFGSKLAEKLNETSVDDSGEYIKYEYVEEYFSELSQIAQKGSAIHILDSLDALGDKASADAWEDSTKAISEGKDTKGSYGMTKQKYLSNALQQSCRLIDKSDIVAIIISQTRDKIDASFIKMQTRSGGRALKFYCNHEIWVARAKTLYKTVNGKKRKIGMEVKFKIEKNSLTGLQSEIVVPVYYSYGIDDVGSCVDYLCSEGYWKSGAGKVLAPEFFEERVTREKLIQTIDNDDELYEKLIDLTGVVWNDILSKCVIKRKKKYE